MKSSKNFLALVLAALMLMSVLSACGSSPAPASAAPATAAPASAAPAAPAAGSIKLTAAHVLAIGGHYDQGLLKFAELVNEKSGGEITVEVFGGGVLGSERDMIESMQMGTLDIGLISAAPLGGFLPEMMVFDLPFIFQSYEHAWDIADGEVGTKLLEMCESQELVGLCYFDNGFRNLFINKPVNSVSDLAGAKVRVMENAVHTATWEALGALATPMAWGEVYTGLQQKTVDGAENSIVTVYSSSFYDVADYLVLTKHCAGTCPFLMAKSTWDTLSADQQAIIRECALAARDYERELMTGLEDNYLADLPSKGMEVIEPDRDSLIAATEHLYDELADSCGLDKSMIQAILDWKA